jgi:acyl-CoA thioester hydrolase
MLREHEIEVRVRYFETDAMGLLHHANYFIYFEMGRTEMLRAGGGCYREMEQSGTFIVVVKADCRYVRPAHYDDLLKIRSTVTRVTGAKIEHEYRVLRGEELLAVGHTVLAVVDRNGKVLPVPEWLRPDQD